MKKLIKFSILALIIGIVIISIIIMNLEKNKEKENIPNENVSFENEIVEEKPQDSMIELSLTTTKEENDFVVFSISSSIQNLFDNISNKYLEAVYGVTSLDYINKNNVNRGNIASVYTDNIEKKDYYIQEVYKLEDYEKQVYYTYGIVLEGNNVKDCYLKVKIQNELYSIEPISKDEYSKAKSGNINTLENVDIKENIYNKYNYMNLSSKELAENYIKDFIVKTRYNIDEAYELLDNSYRQNRFKSISDFKNYINSNNGRFNNLSIVTCKPEIKENSREYIIIDNNNNFYKIIVYSAMNYKVILER